MKESLTCSSGIQAIGGARVMNCFELPDIIELNEYRGNFSLFLEAIYNVFKKDFVTSKPSFKGVRLGLKKFPLVEGKEYTFYHMTHKGDIENERIPDFRRMERIAWPRPMIDNSGDECLKVWRNIRRGNGGTKNRILILHETERYLVVLDDRGDYILPWTAFLIEGNRQLQKYLKEYEAYRTAEAAKKT
ncbi:hypothetical protein [Natronoflexus pectinivorans]|uniref:Uncharacterized protein n=1 Tax=Natronoflexus pectinivorans TaxID=682526 RepID=A0A4R2GG27_9BACT|nr:hypothetical protein [Natronoflexus pectinivorans]TCO06970.1 hypothetical protein EV194_11190 [Natronoflexus pectinivorans]